jgi:hypothetical protein
MRVSELVSALAAELRVSDAVKLLGREGASVAGEKSEADRAWSICRWFKALISIHR